MAYGFREIVEANGPDIASRQLCEIAKEKKISLSTWGLRELHEAFVGSDHESFIRPQVGYQQVEEASPITSSAFSNIVGVLLTNEVIAGYDSVEKIGDEMVTVYKSNQKNEVVPGFTAQDANFDDVEEAQEYPPSGFTDKYVTAPDPKKKGKIIYITEEAIFFDQTGQVIERANGIGVRLAENREKRILSGVCGYHQCYSPAGVATDLYGAAPRLVTSNALVDWTDIEYCDLNSFDIMTDEAGEKIFVAPKIVLVPSGLYRTALRIVRATSVAHVTGTATIETYSANPINPGELKVLTSRLVATYAGASTSWFMGDPKRQFRWKEVWPLQTFRLAANNLLEFQRDIKYAFKVRYRGDIFAIDNKYMAKNTA